MAEEKKCCTLKVLQLVLLVLILISSTVSAFYGYKINSLMSGTALKQIPQVSISKAYAKNQTIEKAQATGKPTVVLFYADWCGYCKRFAPVFNEIIKTRKFKSKLAVAFVNGTDEQNKKYMQEYQIEGFPTVYMVNFKTGEKVKLSNNLLFTPNAKKELLTEFINFAKKTN